MGIYNPDKLAQGGTNTQGVPLGLVNWMCHNRQRVLPNQPHIKVPIADLNIRGGGVSVLRLLAWKGLALSRPGEFGSRGFMDITQRDLRMD